MSNYATDLDENAEYRQDLIRACIGDPELRVPLGRGSGLDSDSAVARLLWAFLNGRKPEAVTAYRQDDMTTTDGTRQAK